MRHREILFQNDAYTAKGTVQLKVDEFGVFYVFVETDRYNRVSPYSHPHAVFNWMKRSILIGSLSGPNFAIRTTAKMDCSRTHFTKFLLWNIEQKKTVETFLLSGRQFWLNFYESGLKIRSICLTFASAFGEIGCIYSSAKF